MRYPHTEEEATVEVVRAKYLYRAVVAGIIGFVVFVALVGRCAVAENNLPPTPHQPTYQEVCMQHGGSVYVDNARNIDCIMPNVPIPIKK